MKERPILFRGEMVRAILSGIKTQTRRVLKPQPSFVNQCGIPFYPDGKGPVDYRDCPYGQPGDRLWVRETWMKPEGGALDYRAKWTPRDERKMPVHEKWRPSIFMPRWASRITLGITDVRVERLQMITDSDSLAEGAGHLYDAEVECPRAGFARLWDSINAKRGCGWNTNPWVWVVKFEVLEDGQ